MGGTHLHITAWVLGLILFIIALVLYKKSSNKPATIVHMILRLVYLFIIITGGLLTWDYIQGYSMPILGEVIVKALAGLWIVVMMEMILVAAKKGQISNRQMDSIPYCTDYCHYFRILPLANGLLFLK